MVPSNFVNFPRTFAMTRWRTEKWIPEWPGSMVHFVVGILSLL
jgi:hypothetical protein